jgi:hypothetical protein
MSAGMGLLRSIVGTPAGRAAGWALGIGWTPLLLYLAYAALIGERNPNPIGLGLLCFFSTPVAMVLALIGIVQGAQRRRHEAQAPAGRGGHCPR